MERQHEHRRELRETTCEARRTCTGTGTGTGTHHDALTSTPQTSRMTTHGTDKDTGILERYGPGPDGKENPDDGDHRQEAGLAAS
ncbi:hypothetical protein ASD77_13560 [Pseudoxanthomonas sp. Root65]|uniref:hypothetical protein n=1 Tax=Pseudoxanthomonas sp. Root65 TaxID=1736576 RepID=UPI0006F3003A|nr:hypothetical protein [Pseudoxanthomonas sp. Root65]KRA52654.1 hypothetical protein ASD77_13560 [Pseudoxanthomonas sp. Root65]